MAEDAQPLTAREVSVLSGIPLSTFQRWVRAGRYTPMRKLAGRTGPYIFNRSILAELANLDDTEPAA